MKVKDITGQKFGRLTIISKMNNYHKKRVWWLCICDCGNLVEISGTTLRSGHTKSCGCLNHEPTNYKHGKAHTRLYKIYHAMKKRCYNKNYYQYPDWGGRGITICDEWLDDFTNFYNWAIDNGYKENLTIDRIDNDKNYEPANCRWITLKEQQSNKRSNVYLTYNGKTQTMVQWSEELNTPYITMQSRHRKGWSDKECLFGRGNE